MRVAPALRSLAPRTFSRARTGWIQPHTSGDSKSERYELLYSLRWGDTSTNNFGFAPAPGDHPERFQLEMYAQLHERLLAHGGGAGRLLEISCGRGGGLHHLVARSPLELFAVGLDLSAHAIRYCQGRYRRPGRLAFVRAHALQLPFADASFDAVVNIEASHAYGEDDSALFAEVHRVLRPDGNFLYADSRRRRKLGPLEELARATGFVGEFIDITEHVVLVEPAGQDRRRALIRGGVPWYWRLLMARRLAQYAALPGSRKFEAFRRRERIYFMACLRCA